MTRDEATTYGKVVMDLPEYVSAYKQMKREERAAELAASKKAHDDRWNAVMANHQRMLLAQRRQAQWDFIAGCILITLFGILPAYIYLLKTWWLT